MLEYYPCSNGISILYQRWDVFFLIHEFLKKVCLVFVGGPQMYGRTHLPFRKVMGLWLPNLWVTPNGFSAPAQYKVYEKMMVKIQNNQCLLHQNCRFKSKVADLFPTIHVRKTFAATDGTYYYGSKYWLPGFGGLIRGQIYNPEVRCKDWVAAILQGPEALQELLVQRTNLNKACSGQISRPNPNAQWDWYSCLHEYLMTQSHGCFGKL